MVTQPQSLDELVSQLPPDAQSAVVDFVEFLLQKHSTQAEPKQKYLRLSWAGALSDLRSEFTSVELQHQALDWWEDSVSG